MFRCRVGELDTVALQLGADGTADVFRRLDAFPTRGVTDVSWEIALDANPKQRLKRNVGVFRLGPHWCAPSRPRNAQEWRGPIVNGRERFAHVESGLSLDFSEATTLTS